MNKQFDISTGMLVRTSDGQVLGKISACEDGSFCIAKGSFFPEDYKAAHSDVRTIMNGEVYLVHCRNDLLSHDYEEGTPSYFDNIAA